MNKGSRVHSHAISIPYALNMFLKLCCKPCGYVIPLSKHMPSLKFKQKRHHARLLFYELLLEGW